MDFSSVNRALESLQRRRPALDQSVLDLATTLQQESSQQQYVDALVQLLLDGSQQERWEPLAVGLYVATDLLEKHTHASAGAVYVEGPRVPTTSQEKDDNDTTVTLQLTQEQLVQLSHVLLNTCHAHLEHKEPRVRTLVAKAVGAVVALEQDELQHETILLHDSVVASIHRLLQEGRDASEQYSKSSTGALDDTTGWRSLETNWQALASYIAAASSGYWQYHSLNADLLEACRYSSVVHVNRHVRAAGIAVLEQWIKIAPPELLQASELRETTVLVLKDSLADNWSQVRMAGSVLCRTFFQQLQTSHITNLDDKIYTVLIPRMCLNRFYLAQGVKLYSHDTWKLVFPQGGLEAVAAHAGAVSRYYVQMADADNHVVREAACQAIAELATKLGTHPQHKDKLQPYVHTLLQALIVCFHDESWPVRDEACLACGIFCKAYPQECLEELPLLKEKWTEQLTDQIWSVRQDAAVALADAMEAYPELLEFLLKILREKLPSAREQPSMTREEYLKQQNDIQSHTDSQLYSCGSLAPKLRKGGAGRIGCSSCGITRPKAPWEATDGCIYLIREVLAKKCPELGDDVVLPLLQELADVCRVKHFPQADDLRATLWRQLPAIAASLGKQRFKRMYLELFVDLMMQNLEERTASALSKHAAGQCAEELANFVGPTIFRGRLDDFQQETFDRAMLERRQAPKGPTMAGSADAFSPFGPPGLLDGGAMPGGQMSGAMPPGGGAMRPVPGSGFTENL